MTKEQAELLKQQGQLGDIIYEGDDSAISSIISNFQYLKDHNAENDKFTHSAFLNAEKQICESTWFFQNMKIFSGVRVCPIDAWIDGKPLTHLALQRIDGLQVLDIIRMTAYGKEMQQKGIKYPIMEVVGTGIEVLNYKLLQSLRWINPPYFEKCMWEMQLKQNLLNAKTQFYCISFVNQLFSVIGKRLLPSDEDESIALVPDGFRTALPNKIIRLI